MWAVSPPQLWTGKNRKQGQGVSPCEGSVAWPGSKPVWPGPFMRLCLQLILWRCWMQGTVSEYVKTRWQEGDITDITGTGFLGVFFLSLSFCLFWFPCFRSTARPEGKTHSSVTSRTVGERRAGRRGSGLASISVAEEAWGSGLCLVTSWFSCSWPCFGIQQEHEWTFREPHKWCQRSDVFEVGRICLPASSRSDPE